MTVKSQLVDARNWQEQAPILFNKISQSGLIGFDIETHDANRHDGLNQFMKVNDDGHKSKATRLVFDVNRTVVTGFSTYCDKDDTAYYFNLAHADVENRLPWDECRKLLDSRPSNSHFICHNAPFELTMMRKSLGYELRDVICTLQLAVSAFGPDQYEQSKMLSCGFGGISTLLPQLASAFTLMDPSGDLTEKQADLMSKVLAKESDAAWSYNGLVKELAWGYGLKKLTKSLFGYQMTTFEETLRGRAHMGLITGEEVVDYGADDAYWAVRIFHKLLPWLPYQNDKLLTTFMEQENPMIHVFADIWSNGMKLNLEAVKERREVERQIYAQHVRDLHEIVNSMDDFPVKPNQWLMKETWYARSNGQNYRNKLRNWARRPLPADDFAAAHTTSGSVTTAWAADRGLPKSAGPNFSHYMMMRTLMYDLFDLKPIYQKGKIGSDGEARKKLMKKHPEITAVVEKLNAMAGVEQRMKLYLNPYLMLCDPETQRVYPVVTSQLASRRMAAAFPNPMQLAKRGESTYIRGFYEADEDDHVIISIDWSQIELVLIGDFSGDEGFKEAYGQLPFNDLHTKAVADMHDVSVTEAKAMPDFKSLRTKVGKGANFNYWYSGALSTVGDAMGWSSDKMWDMTQKYRDTFPQAEEWRVDLIAEARENGFVTLPDGHRRVRFEATYEWQMMWKQRFAATGAPGLVNFGDIFIKKITNRAANQIVNSMIQGSCATLAKRSILRINREIKEQGLRARFMIPIHDELVFSVHRDDAIRFLRMAKAAMCDHPEIIKDLCVDATASMGRTFEPYHPEKAPFGQIELDEAPAILGFEKDSKLTEPEIERVIAYLFEEERIAA